MIFLGEFSKCACGPSAVHIFVVTVIDSRDEVLGVQKFVASITFLVFTVAWVAGSEFRLDTDVDNAVPRHEASVNRYRAPSTYRVPSMVSKKEKFVDRP